MRPINEAEQLKDIRSIKQDVAFFKYLIIGLIILWLLFSFIGAGMGA